jgi:iron complex outermembrane receptor protein
LQRLLDGSGLTYRMTGGGAVTLERARPSSADAPLQDTGVLQAAPIRVTAQRLAQGEVLPMEPITVQERAAPGYVVREATTATKTDTPLMLTPATVNVVPQELIEDRKATRIEEALQTVPGVSTTSTRIVTQNLDSRGFNARQTGNVFRNGLRFAPNSNIAPELMNLERFEVLKGPASTLYGISGLGGIINVVTKRPFAEPTWVGEGWAGMYDFYRGAVDLNTPLNANRTLLVRLNGGYETSGSFTDFLEYDRYVVAPAFTVRLTPRTTLTLDLENVYLDNSPNEQGLPAVGTALPNPNGAIPRNRYVGEPNQFIRRNQLFTGYLLDHRFNEAWSVHQGFQYHAIDDRTRDVNTRGLTADQRSVTRGFFAFDTDSDALALDTYVNGKFTTGPVGHDLAMGVDLYQEESRGIGSSASIAPLDLFQPVYGASPGPLSPLSNTKAEQQMLGLYVQEQVLLFETLRLLLSGRMTIAATENRNRLSGITTKADDVAFTPRFGLVYTPITRLSLFFSYAESFFPALGSTVAGTPFEPETGVAYEGGIKTAWFDGSLLATASVFHMTRQNVLTTDPNNPGFRIQTGEQRSQGIEAQLQGTPLSGWNVTLGGAYLDAKVTKDNTIPVGSRIRSVPELSASLWTTYELQEGQMRGLGFGGGLFYVGRRSGDALNTFNLPSYVRGDLVLFYRQPHYEVGLNIKNIANTDYFAGSLSRNLVYLGEPLSVIGSVRLKF